MLSNSRILAQTTDGQNTVILAQADSSYVLVLGTFIYTKSKNLFSKKTTKSFTVVAEKYISREEALLALEQISRLTRKNSNQNSNNETRLALSAATIAAPAISAVNTKDQVEFTQASQAILLLETAKEVVSSEQSTKPEAPVISPYYPTKDIFLASQMTCAPNLHSK